MLFIFIPYYTFDEDIKMLKTSSLELIMVLCVFPGSLGGEHISVGGNRGAHGAFSSLKTRRPAAVYHRQVLRYRLDRTAHVPHPVRQSSLAFWPISQSTTLARQRNSNQLGWYATLKSQL